MSEHWSSQYVGRPYIDDVYDCAALLEEVQRDVFKRNVNLPKERQDHIILSMRQIDKLKDTYLAPISEEEAVDGDVVLMVCRGALSHIGVLCVIDGTRYVLHNLKTSGNVTLHNIRHLERILLKVGGYYRCREKEADIRGD